MRALHLILPGFGEGDRALLQGAVEGRARLRSAFSFEPETARMARPLHHAARAARSPSPEAGRSK